MPNLVQIKSMIVFALAYLASLLDIVDAWSSILIFPYYDQWLIKKKLHRTKYYTGHGSINDEKEKAWDHLDKQFIQWTNILIIDKVIVTRYLGPVLSHITA